MVMPLIISISGLPKSGKSHLSMTFPAPLKIFSFDLGATYIAENKFADKEIVINEIALPIIEDDDEQWAEPIWNAFRREYKDDIESGKYETIVLDTATVVWQICHQAITEEKNRKKMLEVEYMKPNLKMSSLFARARVAGVNLVTIQYLRDKYVKGDNTGELELDGWKRTAGNADVVIEMKRMTLGEGARAKNLMRATIVDNRFDRDLNGTFYDDTDYNELVALLGV